MRVVRGIGAAMVFLLLACPGAFGEGKVPKSFDEAYALYNNTVRDITETKCIDPKTRGALVDSINQAISQLKQFAQAEGIKLTTQPLLDKLGNVVTPGLSAILKRPPSQFADMKALEGWTGFMIGRLSYLVGKIAGKPSCPPPPTGAATPPPPKEVPTCPTTPVTAGSLQAELKTLFQKVQKTQLGMESSSQLEIEKRIQSLENEIQNRKFMIKQVTEDPGRYTPEDKHPATWLEELKEAQTQAEEDLKTLQKMLELTIKLDHLSYNPCPGTGKLPSTENVTLLTGTDNETWCTYGDGIEMYTPLIETDENGIPIEATASERTTSKSEATESPGPRGTSKGPPATPETPNVAEVPPEGTPTSAKPTPETPQVTEDSEPPTTTPETPQITEKPLEEPPATPIPDTIFVKAKEWVLKGQPTGNPIQNQVVKLFPPDKPDLPGAGTKEAEDTGFDKGPVQCTTGADGQCKLQVSTEDGALYGLPGTDEQPGKNYRRDYDLAIRSGGVAETTGGRTKPETGAPEGAEVTTEEFKIGDHTFVRLQYQQSYGQKQAIGEEFARLYGPKYEEDYCRDQQPGPPLGMQPGSLSALNRQIPEAVVKLKRLIHADRDVQ